MTVPFWADDPSLVVMKDIAKRHSFLHKAPQHELRPCLWAFSALNDDDPLPGFTDGSCCNSWDTVYMTRDQMVRALALMEAESGGWTTFEHLGDQFLIHTGCAEWCSVYEYQVDVVDTATYVPTGETYYHLAHGQFTTYVIEESA